MSPLRASGPGESVGRAVASTIERDVADRAGHARAIGGKRSVLSIDRPAAADIGSGGNSSVLPPNVNRGEAGKRAGAGADVDANVLCDGWRFERGERCAVG